MIVSTIVASNCTPQTIVIGRRGTYDTMQIVFDLSYLIENYGSGTAVLAVKRSQDTSAYPAVVTQEDNILTWTVSETDTYYVGSGECQLMWYVDGGLAKTIIYPMVVMRDILSTTEEPPDGYENWIESLTALGAETQQNAQNAAQSASDASTAKDDAVTAKEAAEAAQEAAETAVTHYPKIENNYWMVWDVASQSYVSTGIQAEGEDGYSPEVTITTITGGHRVTITDKDHPQGQSFDVMDGQGGGGTSDYTSLTNKPQINGHTLTGNQTAAQLGLATPSDIPTVPVQSVAGKTGAITLDAGDIAYDDSETYQSGSVGAELSDLNRQLSDKQDAPATAGTAGQVLGLDSNLDPVWVNQSGGGGDTSNCAPIIINTASGNIASFADGADNRKIRKIVGTIVPQQAAGTPSPENPLTISGWTGAVINHSGANMSAPATLTINWESEAGVIYGGTVQLNENGSVDVIRTSVIYTVNGNSVGEASYTYTNVKYAEFQKPSNSALVGIDNATKICLCSIGTIHRPAGNFDNSARINQLIISATSQYFWYGFTPGTTLEEMKETLDGVVICYELKPAYYQTFHFDNIGTLMTYLGTNNIWIDTGAITECDYPADTKLYIDGKLAEIQATILENIGG